MSKGSRTDLCGGWPERAIPTATVGVLSSRTTGFAVIEILNGVPQHPGQFGTRSRTALG